MLTRPKTIPGFKWGKLAETLADSRHGRQSHFIVVAEWASESSYAEWQSMAMPSLSKEAVRTFLDCLDNPAAGKLYEVRQSS